MWKLLIQTNFDLIVLAVPHKKFKNIDFKLIKQDSTLIYDIKILSEKLLIKDYN